MVFSFFDIPFSAPLNTDLLDSRGPTKKCLALKENSMRASNVNYMWTLACPSGYAKHKETINSYTHTDT